MPRAFPGTVRRRLPGAAAAAAGRCQPGSVSGLPLPCLKRCLPYAVAYAVQEPLGPPTFCDASLPACHGRRTPADRHRLARPVVRGGPAGACNPAASAPSRFEAVPALQEARSPLRPPGGSVDASPRLCAAWTTPTPPWTQDALRVGGSSLPVKDFHLAR